MAVEGQEEGEAHYRISTCDCSAPAAQVGIVARRESRIGFQDAPSPAVEEVEEDRLLLEPAGWVWGVEVVAEGRRSHWGATVQSWAVEQTAPVAEEGRGEEWERLVVGPREVVVAPGLLRQLEAPLRIRLVARLGSRIDLISAHSVGQPPRVQTDGVPLFIGMPWNVHPRSQPSRRDTDGRLVLEGRRAGQASRPWFRLG